MIKTLFVIHHSHTDIGYTHGQGRIVRWHAQYIREAMQIAERQKDFVWTCETFWPVEQFFAAAGESERRRFVELCRSGQIGLTGGFLHFMELPDRPLLDALAGRARDFAAAHGFAMESAMLADVNGCSLAPISRRFLPRCL